MFKMQPSVGPKEAARADNDKRPQNFRFSNCFYDQIDIVVLPSDRYDNDIMTLQYVGKRGCI